MAITSQIRINPVALAEVKQLLEESKKIAAIKHARKHGREHPAKEVLQNDGTVEQNDRPGLRSAKDAVEHLLKQNSNPTCVFAPQLRIKKVIVEGEKGEFELDVDELQLRLLDGLGTLPLSEVAAMTDLVTYIRNWQGDDVG